MKKMGFLALVVAGVLGATGTADAVSATQTCTITKIGLTANRISVTCSETATIHQIAGPGYSASCPAQTADDMRGYQSLLLSAYLASKRVTLQYDTPTTCTGPANLSGSRVVFAVYIP